MFFFKKTKLLFKKYISLLAFTLIAILEKVLNKLTFTPSIFFFSSTEKVE